jgi:anti-sigma B factor antagonist
MDENNLEITDEIIDGICRFTVKGRIDSNNADMFLEKLEKAITEGNINIIINMQGIEYLSSIGIRIILRIYKQVTEKQGKLNIEKPSNIVKNVLGMVALKEMLVS